MQDNAESVAVDLKFSLWSQDRAYWDERTPGVWDRMATLPVGGSLTVNTAPWKEIRFGEIAITHYAEGWFARGTFWVEWDDDPDDLGGNPRVEIDVDEDEPNFDALMIAIDRREAELIKAEHNDG